MIDHRNYHTDHMMKLYENLIIVFFQFLFTMYSYFSWNFTYYSTSIDYYFSRMKKTIMNASALQDTVVTDYHYSEFHDTTAEKFNDT